MNIISDSGIQDKEITHLCYLELISPCLYRGNEDRFIQETTTVPNKVFSENNIKVFLESFLPKERKALLVNEFTKGTPYTYVVLC